MTTSSGAAPQAAGLGLVPALLGLVRFSHTIFALPFAFAAACLARMEIPPAATLGWILLAMVGARSLAMALNRLIDADIDARNPRTAGREMPSGRLSVAQVVGFCGVSLAVLLVAVSQLPRITWILWPIPVAAFVLYPLAKRVTWLCHLALGLTIGLAPVGAWLAVTGGLTCGAGHAGPGGGRAGSPASTSSTRCWTWTSTAPTASTRSRPASARRARSGSRAACTSPRSLLLVGTGLAAGAGPIYMVGVAVCAAVLLYENAIVRPGDVGRIQAAFGQSNGLLAVRVPAVHPGRGDAVDPDVLVRGRGLVKAFGDRRAVDRVDVDLAAGECLAVLGPNGAGKSTLLRMLATLLRPEAGELSVCGAPLPDRAIRARAEIGYLGHDPLVYLDLTARQNLELYADLYGLDGRARADHGGSRPGRAARALVRPRAHLQPRHGAAPGPGPRAAAPAAPAAAGRALRRPRRGGRAAAGRRASATSARTRGAVMITHEVERGVAHGRPRAGAARRADRC